MPQAIKLPQVGEVLPNHSTIVKVVSPAPTPLRAPGITRAQVQVKNAKGNLRVEDYLVVWK